MRGLYSDGREVFAIYVDSQGVRATAHYLTSESKEVVEVECLGDVVGVNVDCVRGVGLQVACCDGVVW